MSRSRLPPTAAATVAAAPASSSTITEIEPRRGLDELDEIATLVEACGYGADRIRIDPSVVRGLEYYTGPVFEAELTFKVTGDDGQPVRFGSVGGGGRYDDLVARFTGQRVPATGFSIGVSRLLSALQLLKKNESTAGLGPVVVLVMDRKELPRYQRFAQKLRQGGIAAEMYLGTSGMKAQMKYADRRGAPCVVIQGGDETRQGRGPDQGSDRRRQGRRDDQGFQGMARGAPGPVLGAGGSARRAVKGVLDRHSGDPK